VIGIAVCYFRFFLLFLAGLGHVIFYLTLVGGFG
jgi:hypothetical protein